ncbi:hypothetical protein [Reichenbachiella sp. MALMAid0571]|uniref:DUF6913 domain-containing protein n=1 Tax=Reichenbachiella sp. MALMAid0571 TaxID=3143939 RepID=UPI0032DEC61C
MFNKYFLSFKTASAIKSPKADRGTNGFSNSLRIGILFTYSDKHNFELVNEMMGKLEQEGKSVDSITYIVKMGENDSYPFPFFNIKDIDFWGNWKKTEVNDFINIPFDYLLSLDLNINNITQNILALSMAKCRVGRYEEGKSDYFELMIDHKEDDYEQFIDQVYHYIKNLRNGE